MGDVIDLYRQRLNRLPKRQRKCLEYVTGYRARFGGNWPSFAAIAEALGLKSPWSAVRVCNSLERARLLPRRAG